AELDRLRVDACGEGEAPALELAADAEIEVRGEGDREQCEREAGVADVPAELRALGLDLAEDAAAEHGANCTLTLKTRDWLTRAKAVKWSARRARFSCSCRR